MEEDKFVKLLKDRGIEYKIRNYPIELRDTTLVAKFVEIPASQLFKSLVLVENDNKPLLVMIPSDTHLNLGELNSKLGLNLKLANRAQAKALTGMEVGGISPLGLLDSDIQIYISKSVTKYNWVVFSAGQRGVTIQLSVPNLLKITKAQILSNDY